MKNKVQKAYVNACYSTTSEPWKKRPGFDVQIKSLSL